MTSFVMYHVKSTVLIRVYSSLSAARCGMRTSNRNAGWLRVSRCSTGVSETEWCRPVNSGEYVNGYYSISTQPVNGCEYADGPYAIATEHNYYQHVVKVRTVRNLMTGTDIEIPSNTPASCDPSTEIHWSM